MKTFVESLNSAVRNWWLSLLLGILYIALAIWLFVNPLASYLAISMVFSVFMFVSGLFGIIFALGNRHVLANWGWYLSSAIIDLLIGIVLLASPELSMAVLAYILAFWLLFRGFSGIGHATDLRRYGAPNWGWSLALAILAVIFAIGILMVPAAGAVTFVVMVGCALLAFGIFRILVAFELRRLHKLR